MKTHGSLYPQIITFENIYLAAKKAQKGKRYRQSVLGFNYRLENELVSLQQELTQQTYQPGNYRTFLIREPKQRTISAAPYRDRVVHHALCNVIVPIFERTYTRSSYANRVGFGTHKALKRFVNLSRTYRYVLQCDLQKYFPSIDHEILKSLLRRKIRCQRTRWLIDTIIDNSNEQILVHEYFPGDELLTPLQRRRGLPIGNLTSQFFANVYLNGFDHFVTETLKFGSYLRYVDDFAIFSNDRDALVAAREQIENYLTQLRLKIHPIKSQLIETKHPLNFLGFRVFPNTIRIRSDNLRRARHRLRKLEEDLQTEKISTEKAKQSLQSWFAHLAHGNTWRLRQQISASLAWARE
ncbi:MAG: RNA-directed DNA polymerase [Cyanobacteria bacterium P01_H01_bin.15]